MKRINKDGTLNYFEIIKAYLTLDEVIIFFVLTVLINCLITVILYKDANLLKISMLLFIYMIHNYFLINRSLLSYRKYIYDKDFKKAKICLSKKAFKNLKENMKKFEIITND